MLKTHAWPDSEDFKAAAPLTTQIGFEDSEIWRRKLEY